ncbi:flavodoxin domain-containing protein [Streptomyces sp. NBC_00237]|uniref:flavodoxin domain-containing protein n=1 Tax=Streptomyces sp. NBC_00237 TaxID=2975687 RepID=UPI0022517DDB|nr:flavodoxin domain-containing protein [Streptomyces sp. NBC_00237]MCX5205783.1 flavodoxin domain-containing protein [Streptomyces sp. NBC_00237]
MSLKVLVAYETKNGSTKDIAGTIAQVLGRAGLDTDLRPVAEAGDPRGYDAVVLGSALYTGRWLKGARRFAARNEEALSERPVWLFSSGPLDATASERDIPPVPGVRRVKDRTEAREHVTFGGALHDDAHGWVARKIVESGKGGDFRDFAEISAWADRIAGALSGVRQWRASTP